ncbi:MAG TPA: hypothetical protein VK390_13985, partial [Propionibacteriaceae bacterium]|nr:hypothetical protein [Propionibacteriaceae bacterium]
MHVKEGTRKRLKMLLPIMATVAIVAPLAWLWQASLLPKSYSVMDMGYSDFGGGTGNEPAASGGHGHAASPGTRSVVDFTADAGRQADVRVDLVAAQADLMIGGKAIA